MDAFLQLITAGLSQFSGKTLKGGLFMYQCGRGEGVSADPPLFTLAVWMQ